MQMDLATLAMEAVSLLAPYLAKGSRTIADKVDKDVWSVVSSKVETLYNMIKDKFDGNDYASQTLKRLEEKSGDKDRQRAMEGVLKEIIDEDFQFQKRLGRLLMEIRQVGGGCVIQVYGSGAAATQGGVAAGKGGYAAGGNINIGSHASDDEE